MHDRILPILSRLRRRTLAARTAEAAAVGGTAGGLVAASVMAAWVLAGRLLALASAVSAAPLLGGLAVAVWPGLALKLRLTSTLRWSVAAIMMVPGAIAAACIATGAFVHVPKNWLILAAPVAAAAAAVVALVRGPTLGGVAADVDARAALRERLSTAWELAEGGEESAFADAVQAQALSAAGRDLRGISFWNRSPATLGALGLAILASVLMLPWEPLQSPAALRQQRWQRLSAQAGQQLQQHLARLEAAGDLQLADTIRRLQQLTRRLRSATPTDARQWRGPVVDLEKLAESLRRAVRSGRLEPRAAEQIAQLIRTLEQTTVEIAEGMGEDPGEIAAGAGAGKVPQPSTRPRPTAPGYTTVYHPSYADLAPATTASAPAIAHEAPPVSPAQVPYDQAWLEARRRAAATLGRGQVPARYRQLVRDYFATEQ